MYTKGGPHLDLTHTRDHQSKFSECPSPQVDTKLKKRKLFFSLHCSLKVLEKSTGICCVCFQTGIFFVCDRSWARDPLFSQPFKCLCHHGRFCCVCVLVNAISHWTMGNFKTQALPHLFLSPESLLQSKCPIICMSNKALKNMSFNYRLLYPISSFKVLLLLNRNTVRCYI